MTILSFARRNLLQWTLCLAGRPARARTHTSAGARFDPADFATVGVFGLDWLLDPRFTTLLDHLAASPGAVLGIRAFGALSLGRDKTFPTTTGGVWPDPAAAMDFTRTLQALTALVSRGLTPFLPLTFFPAAVSPHPIQPPPDWAPWQALVRAFLDACVQRFGAPEVATWWFEVWNEPNMPPFWAGDFDRYLGLYRATAAAVRRSAHRIRLGGPVLAYLPGEGPALMERFLQLLAAEPELQCDFLSLHRKGVWTNEEREPDLRRLIDAADATARSLLRIAPSRAPGMAIVNDEADMRVGFDAPYAPRTTAQFPCWLAASAIAHDALSARYAAHGIRFLAFSDNANQQLAQSPFDGRRTLLTPLANPEDQIKLPVFGFYELLRLMRPNRVATQFTPPPGITHLLTGDEHGLTALFTHYADAGTIAFDYTLTGLPWPRVNLVTFCIDATHTSPRAFFPDDLAAMRRAQELAALTPLRSGLPVRAGTLRPHLELGPFATMLLWVTPFRPGRPAPPRPIEASRGASHVQLRWTPARSPSFYSYEVLRNGLPIAPDPLRAALWLDTAAPAGPLRYAITTVSASGRRSPALTIVV